MDEWWNKTDCTLTPETLQALLITQAPELDANTLRYLNQGWDSWVYTASHRDGTPFILRFPKRAGVARRLQREIILLPVLAPRLRLAIPQFRLIGKPDSGYPHPFVGYARLPGRPAIDVDPAGRNAVELGAVLGTFLGTLHDFPVEDARKFGVEDGVEEEDGEIAAKIETAQVQLTQFGDLLDETTRNRIHATLHAPAPMQLEEQCMLHNDFYPEHLLVEESSLSGVIDWGDVAIADPARDLAGLFSWLGTPCLHSGIATYTKLRAARLGTDAASRLTERARFFSVCRALEDLDYGTRAGREEYVRVGLRTLRYLCAA